MISASDKADVKAILVTQPDNQLISLLELCRDIRSQRREVDFPFSIRDSYVAVRHRELGPILEDLLTIRCFSKQHGASASPDYWDETTKTLFAIQHPEVTL